MEEERQKRSPLFGYLLFSLTDLHAWYPGQVAAEKSKQLSARTAVDEESQVEEKVVKGNSVKGISYPTDNLGRTACLPHLLWPCDLTNLEELRPLHPLLSHHSSFCKPLRRLIQGSLAWRHRISDSSTDRQRVREKRLCQRLSSLFNTHSNF